MGRSLEEIEAGGIPSSFVPSRNTVFLAVAYGMAKTFDADAIYAGMNDQDATGYPDCRKDFLEAMEKAGCLGIDREVRIILPVMDKTKAGVVILGEELGVPWRHTVSCYVQTTTEEPPCGECDSCVLRTEGFKKAGVEDPTMR